jgi:hypothetical protein
METESELKVPEEPIKFKTNLDSATYNVADTLPLFISIISKIPSSGVKISVKATWTDSSKLIYQLDTASTQPSLELKMSGFEKPGEYSISIEVNSIFTISNSLHKNIVVVNNPLGRFQGYKVDAALRSKDEINYWRDCGVLWDVIMYKFGLSVSGTQWDAFMPQLTVGDFNNDGWIDIFNPGTGSYGSRVFDNLQWLIWNPKTKMFDNKTLFKDKMMKSFGGNQRRSIPYDMNKDGFTDVVIFDSGDDLVPNNPLQPIRLVLSDGSGNYDLVELKDITPEYKYNHSGNIGDLNGDGSPDLVVATGDMVYISWGIPIYPYFSNKVSYFDLRIVSDNGFGEWFKEAAGNIYNIEIADINKDGLLDIIEGGAETSVIRVPFLPFDLTNRILINQGAGKFNINGLIRLPFYLDHPEISINTVITNDFRVFDYNGDGLNDILSTGCINYDDFFFCIYIQNSDSSFSIDRSMFTYNINSSRHAGSYGSSWKPWIIFHDFNEDGLQDISYIDAHNYWNNSLTRKTVLIRTGNQFIEESAYKYDIYLNSIKPN